MKRTLLQIILLVILFSLCISGYLLVTHFLQLPFRSTNDALHKKESPINLDFLIPSGTYIDENMNIGEVIEVRFKKETSLYEKILKSISDLIPQPYLFLADLFLFIFWSFLYMTFLRVFTFAGYGRALRSSLLLGGCTYYFMPDFSPGKVDDIFFIGIALLIIIIRAYIHHRKKEAGIS